MEYLRKIKIGNGIGLRLGGLSASDIQILLRDVRGTPEQRIGTIKVQGSPLIKDNTLVELTRQDWVMLAPNIGVMVANTETSSKKLRMYLEIPENCEVYEIN
ncbi:MAG: hypothetical protein AABX32_05365 [Nanoarchaeota archaeon]